MTSLIKEPVVPTSTARQAILVAHELYAPMGFSPWQVRTEVDDPFEDRGGGRVRPKRMIRARIYATHNAGTAPADERIAEIEVEVSIDDLVQMAPQLGDRFVGTVQMRAYDRLIARIREELAKRRSA